MKNKFKLKIKMPKRRNFMLIEAQLKGLLRTRVIKNKKKEIKKFDWKKESTDYLSVMSVVFKQSVL
jgi:hypothetical protein